MNKLKFKFNKSFLQQLIMTEGQLDQFFDKGKFDRTI